MDHSIFPPIRPAGSKPPVPEGVMGIPVAPRLTQMHRDLWVDLSEVVSVKTYTDGNTYHRVVVLTMRNRDTHHMIVVRHTNGSTTSQNDQLLEEWLDKNLRGKIL